MSKYYLLGNYVLTASFIAWFSAQFIKVLINLIKTKKFIWERMWGSGGMPSAHSASVTALTVSIGKIEGVDSALFALAFLNAAIVMYDAMGVRRAAGEQAKVLNRFLRSLGKNEELPPQEPTKKQKRYYIKNRKNMNVQQVQVKEVLGHTPIEVLFGILLGLTVALLIPVN